MLLVRGVEAQPRHRAIRPGAFAQPIEPRISRRELQRQRRAVKHLAEIEHAAGRNYENARAFPRQNLEERIEALLAGISRGKPALVANYVGARRQNPFANSFAFAVLENDVNPKR